MSPSVTKLLDLIGAGSVTPANAREAVRQAGGDAICILEAVRTLAAGATSAFADITGAPGDNTALAAALALKLDKAGGTMTGALAFSGTTHAGLRLNNLTTAQRDAISSPGAGATVWNTTTSRVNVHNGSAWTEGFVRLAGDTMTGALAVAAGSTTSAALSASQTWNSGGTTCQGLLLEITDTASAAASLVACLKVGSTTVFEVSKSGDLASDGTAYSVWNIGRSTGNRTLNLRGGGAANVSISNAASFQLSGGVPMWCRSASSIIGVPRNGSYQFGDADNDFTGTAGCTILSGSGSPEGVRAAKVGSIYLRQDGGASTTLYVKESGTGNTGWVAK